MMEERLKSGVSLILDRYAHSGVAYSAAKGLDSEWCKAPDSGLPRPDLLIFLDLPVESASAREGYGEERYEKNEFQIKVRNCFQSLVDDSWTFAEGTGTIEQVSARIQDVIDSQIDSLLVAAQQPVRYLEWM